MPYPGTGRSRAPSANGPAQRSLAEKGAVTRGANASGHGYPPVPVEVRAGPDRHGPRR
jgi:hypothetical protein